MKKYRSLIIIIVSVLVGLGLLFLAASMFLFSPIEMGDITVELLPSTQWDLNNNSEFYEIIRSEERPPHFDEQIIPADNPFPSEDPNYYIRFHIHASFSNSNFLPVAIQSALTQPQEGSRLRTVRRFAIRPVADIIEARSSEESVFVAAVYMYAGGLNRNTLEEYINALTFELTTLSFFNVTSDFDLGNVNFNYERFINTVVAGE